MPRIRENNLQVYFLAPYITSFIDSKLVFKLLSSKMFTSRVFTNESLQALKAFCSHSKEKNDADLKISMF